MEVHKYQPLSGLRSFRIFQLRRLQFEGPVEGELQEVTLDSHPWYEALSYTWESQSPSVPISIGGKAQLITDNCEKALRRLLRGRLKNRTVWVDSICIDQTSISERNHQVRLMAEIYRRADRVNVWLGPSTEATDTAMSTILKSTLLPIVAHLPGPKASNQGTLPYGFMGSLLTHSWFRRMWVVQEVAMARAEKVMFYCGDRMHRLEVICCALDYSDVPSMPVFDTHFISYLAMAEFLKKAVAAKSSGEPLPRNLTLSGVLAMAVYKEATDPKDKVFGIYGIAHYLGWPLPEPDYEKSLQQIYTEATQYAISNDQSLELLERVPGSLRIEGLPSWVPNISDLPTSGFRRCRSFNAAGTSHIECSFSANGKQLTLAGNFLDLIEVCSSSLTWDLNNTIYKVSVPTAAMAQGFFRTLREWTRGVRQLPAYPTGEPVRDVFARTLFMDGFSTRNTAEVLRSFPSFCSILLEDWNQPTFADGSSIELLDQALEKTYLSSTEFENLGAHAISVNRRRRMVLTAGGMMGTVPYTAQPGDRIVIFAGSKVPSILREQNEGFTYLGPAYLHGAMDGEFWADSGTTLQNYTLI